MNLHLTESQQWLVLRALVDLTSEESEQRLLKDFPEMDIEELVKDVSGILKQLECFK